MNTSAPARYLSRVAWPSSVLRSSSTLSLARLAHTKNAELPSTAVSYPQVSGAGTLDLDHPGAGSASCRVAKGAAIACSTATTITPSSESAVTDRPRAGSPAGLRQLHVEDPPSATTVRRIWAVPPPMGEHPDVAIHPLKRVAARVASGTVNLESVADNLDRIL